MACLRAELARAAILLLSLPLTGCNLKLGSSVGVAPTGPSPTSVNLSRLASPTRATTPEAPTPSSTPVPPTFTPQPPSPTPVTLQELQPDESLILLHEIELERQDFGVELAFSPAGPLLYHSGILRGVQEVDFRTGTSLREFENDQQENTLAVALSPDGRYLAWNESTMVHVADLDSGASVALLEVSNVSVAIHVTFLDSGDLLTGDTAGNAVFWGSGAWEEISRFQYPVKIEAMYPAAQGGTMVMQPLGQSLATFFSTSGQRLSVIPLAGEHPRLIAISPPGDRLIVYANRGFAAEGFLVIRTADAEIERSIGSLNTSTFAVSPNWSLLAVVDSSGLLRLFRLPGGEPILSQDLEIKKVRRLVISPDDQYLGVYSADRGGLIQIWGRARP